MPVAFQVFTFWKSKLASYRWCAPVLAIVPSAKAPSDNRQHSQLRESRDGTAPRWTPGSWRKLSQRPALPWVDPGTARLASRCASGRAESAAALAKRAVGTLSPADRAGAPNEAACLRCAEQSLAPSAGMNPWQVQFPRLDILHAVPRSWHSLYRQDRPPRRRGPWQPLGLSPIAISLCFIRSSYPFLPFDKSPGSCRGARCLG